MKKRVYLILIKDSKVLVVREVGDHLFKLPGGRVENNEDEVKALEREVEEEIQVSLKIKEVKKIGSYESVGQDKVHYYTNLYKGDVEGLPKPDGNEIEEIGWYESDNPIPCRIDFENNVLPILKEQKLIK